MLRVLYIAGRLAYTQLYPRVKELFAAGNIYVFIESCHCDTSVGQEPSVDMESYWAVASAIALPP
jgi:hypothetical protein